MTERIEKTRPAEPFGRIDVHAHLLPGVDDGCANLADSIACARLLIDAGYTHAFCTPHIWPNLTHNNVAEIPLRTAELQSHFDAAGLNLRLLPGGELNLRPETASLPTDSVVTYGMNKRYCIFDLWADKIPPFFEPAVRHLQSLGLKVIVAHPERMRAVQDDPGLVDWFDQLGLLLQGNLQCFSDAPTASTRRMVETLLLDHRYFLLGTDTHTPATLPMRLAGLARAINLAGHDEVDRLTRANPRQLLAI